ncbi:MAG: cell division protein ZapE [Marinicellaceae bacterium]
MSPLQVYQDKLSKGIIKQDILQNEVILGFEDVYQNIQKKNKFWFFKSKKSFKGLYIYGSVGRGKTFLMDLFVDCVNDTIIRRQHFHEFMLWFHQQLRTIKNKQNPIDLVIKQLSEVISVLCLDEFLVHDITDAMLLAGMLKAFEKYNISLITTSNVKPVDLYIGGLQRKKFLPAIDWMQQNMDIIQLDGHYDYRSNHLDTSKTWFYPISQANQDKFEKIFSQLVASDNLHLAPITINKRQLNTIKSSQDHIMFEFDTLCKQPRNANDFIKISQQFKSVFMVINQAIEIDDRNTARRFITLIDVLYDAGTALYVLSEVDFKQLYMGEELAFEMQRTVSRLTQMQSINPAIQSH